MQRYSIRRVRRCRLIRRIGTIILVLFLIVTFFDIRQETPRTSLFPANDGVHRYAGAIHIHSTYSDGGGTVEEIAAAAQRAGLDFIVLTDHSTIQARSVGAQRYHDRLLMLVGEEVNTSAGHLLALGVGRHVEQDGEHGLPALVDAIRAAGGFSILAHPDGRRPWTDWSLDPIDGLEILNADSEWRNDNLWQWLSALIWYPFLPEGTLNSLMDRPEATLQRWQTLSERRRTVGVGSVDAHARIPLWGERTLRFPSYERMFGLLRTYVMTDTPLTGVDSTDCAMILDAIRNGHSYVAVDGYERAVQFSYWLNSGEETAKMGDRVAYHPKGQIHIKVGSSGPVLIRLFRDGVPVAEIKEREIRYPITGPGVYRTEVYQLRRRLPLFQETPRPWIFSNPIWVDGDR